MNNNWIPAVCTSAFCWASADTTFDVILDNETELPSKEGKQNNHLTHSQTMLLCALTTYLIIFSYLIYIESMDRDYIILVGNHSKFTSLQSVPLLILSGIFSYYHYYFIIKAFENSSSTVILPFLQFSSVFAFLFSMIQNYFSNRPYLASYLHLLAYLLILLGGLAPATDGQLGKIFKASFWKQPFVKYAIISDMSHAIYTNFVSFVGKDENDVQHFNLYGNMEFFVLTRVMFVLIFLFNLYRNRQIQIEMIQLFNKPRNLVIGTVVGEVMTLIGYFSSVYAYQCYYQAGVVSAGESSLNLIINLFMAYFLKKYFNIGKQASLHNLGLKIISCVTISIGLTMATV